MINSCVSVAGAGVAAGSHGDSAAYDKGTNYYNYPRTITTLNCIPSGDAGPGECLEENLLPMHLPLHRGAEGKAERCRGLRRWCDRSTAAAAPATPDSSAMGNCSEEAGRGP